jgi:hypothetical protein
LNLKSAFELPPGSGERFQLKSPWKKTGDLQPFEISAQQSHQFNLRPFEVLTLEAKVISGGDRPGTEVLGASANLKNTSLQ